ncbi:hypothetical protein JEOAER750_00156 [Jeotgalicoccus aerolatus]|jgi:hypothetical protein|uniref:Lipoprotein n=1 Tax=Jeotgalicoccus aerolatus TaxID=709510 RepID=A0A1G9AWN5_9STAP|nr:hypothetical protein [Jeotgalicoccus aerolatus]MBP1952075.1 hypothetical protein [Jeotgalicoccus aerolatus]NMA81345.1 hypothetical protein [Jeotgalicoccus aerolatus]CAD2071099.1 hypothetical protein JEOAER750_00156 [Jeotgalicoccus aerolatus]SDK31731.1 hypothetical protein SAMN05216187_10719 [Jeotgalicoccus aerolatus]GGE05740.1 hypothetical protein GCM10007273_17700 [Jeotgalicoccus aerolatus]
MKKSLVMMISILLLTLTGCAGGSESELEGKTLGLSMYNPTVSKEEAEAAEFKFSSNTPVFDFESSKDVTFSLNGSTYTGEYTLEDEHLSITVEDGDASMSIDFDEFKASEEEYASYSGTVSDGELDEGDETTQLTNAYRNFGLDEHYLFLEE